ncbi:hypothetical protein BGW38_001077, partial [Lunasporangiospora selenospora]
MCRLPPDCIHHIVAQLDGDLDTLFNLLTVNSTFFHATLPVLYRDPFVALKRRHRRKAAVDRTLFGDRNDGVLVRSVPVKQLFFLLLLSCKNSYELVPFLLIDWVDPLPAFSETPLMAAYIEYLGHYSLDRWVPTLRSLLPEVDTNFENNAIRIYRLLFLEHLADRVRVLNIPVSHLSPYMPFIPRLKCLKFIDFHEHAVDEDQMLEEQEQELLQEQQPEQVQELLQEQQPEQAEVQAPPAEEQQPPVEEQQPPVEEQQPPAEEQTQIEQEQGVPQEQGQQSPNQSQPQEQAQAHDVPVPESVQPNVTEQTEQVVNQM